MSRRVEVGPLTLLEQSESLSKQTQAMISVYRGWDAYERARGGSPIIDFDLSTVEGSISFHSRRDILAALLDLRDRFDDRSTEEEFLSARVQGSIYYLRALMGEQIPFAYYLRQTLGIDPEFFPEDEVETARHMVNARLAPFNLEMKAEDRERFEASLVIRDRQTIVDGIVGDQKLWLGRLRTAGIPVPDELHLAVEFTEVDAYWSNWISGSVRKGITLSINLHPRKKYDRGRPLALCLHEICGHAVHMSIWSELIAQGKLNPACGLTVVHSPEMFVSEGLGQTVSDLLGDDESFPADFQLSRALQYYTLMVLHNAHLMIYEGLPFERIFGYARERLPFSDPLALESEIRDRGTDPLFRAYQLSYATGEHTIRGLIEGLTEHQKQQFFLGMYTKPLTPKRLIELGGRVRD